MFGINGMKKRITHGAIMVTASLLIVAAAVFFRGCDAKATEYPVESLFRLDNTGPALDPLVMTRFGFVEYSPGIWRGWSYTSGADTTWKIDSLGDSSLYISRWTLTDRLIEIYDLSARFDVNNDGTSNIADLTTIIDIMFRGVPPFPEEPEQ